MALIEENLTFGETIKELWLGKKLRRAVWIPHIWIKLVQRGDLQKVRSIDTHLDAMQTFIVWMDEGLGTARPWVPTHEDLLSNDWLIYSKHK